MGRLTCISCSSRRGLTGRWTLAALRILFPLKEPLFSLLHSTSASAYLYPFASFAISLYSPGFRCIHMLPRLGIYLCINIHEPAYVVHIYIYIYIHIHQHMFSSS